jgi:IS5 family transposase
VDPASQRIVDYDGTSAAVHDSQVFLDFINASPSGVWADSACLSEATIAALREKNPDILINICNRAYRNKPLTDVQNEENKLIAKIRSSVEHVFGLMTRARGGMILNGIGMERARRDIGWKNLGYIPKPIENTR